MLDAILRAAGLRSVAAGNVGLPIVEAVMDPTPYDVFAVELSSFQLHYTDSLAAEAAAVLNLAEDHLDWYDRPSAWTPTPPTRAASTSGSQRACVYNVADPVTEQLVREADVVEGARAIGFTLGMPVGRHARRGRGPPRRPGLHRAAAHQRRRAVHARRPRAARRRRPRTSWPTRWPRRRWPAPTASARPRSATGCAGFRPDGHRIAVVAEHDGVTWVDDSKATNPHAAQSSLLAYDPVVWVAGGLAKGAGFDELVQAVRGRLRGVVLIGRDREVIAEALSRHAPDVPVIVVDGGETDPGRWTALMERVVDAAAQLAVPGDTVLLAPGAPRWTSSPTTPRGATRSPRRCRPGPDGTDVADRRGGDAR